MTYTRLFTPATLFLFFLFFTVNDVLAQAGGGDRLSRIGENRVRIAEPGQIADSVHVWGDFGVQGKFLVPRNTSLPEMISYARGVEARQMGRQDDVQFDWSEQRLEVAISRFDVERGFEEVLNFTYVYGEPIPEEFRDFRIQNQDLVTLQIRRRPSFREYVTFIATTLSAIATTYLAIDNILSD